MDGYEATRQIRLFNKEVIIIVQTAYVLSNENEVAIVADATIVFLSQLIRPYCMS